MRTKLRVELAHRVTINAMICFIALLLLTKFVEAKTENPCTNQSSDLLLATSQAYGSQGNDAAGPLMDAGADAHKRGQDFVAGTYYFRAGQIIQKMTENDWNTVSQSRIRAVDLAAALWQSGHQDEAQAVWRALKRHSEVSGFSKLIAVKLREKDYKTAFQQMRIHFDDYLSPTAANLMGINTTGLKKALNAGANGNFKTAYGYAQSQAYRCYGPNDIVNLIVGMTKMAQGTKKSEWAPIILQSSVSGYSPPGPPPYGNLAQLDVEILSQE